MTLSQPGQGEADDLAMEMTSYETWPRGNAWAQAKLAELQAAPTARKDAPPTVEPAPEVAAKPAKPTTIKKPNAKKKAGKVIKHGGRRRR